MRYLVVLVSLFATIPAFAAEPAPSFADGDILDDQPCAGHAGTYAEYLARHQAFVDALVASAEARLAEVKGTPEEGKRQQGLDEIRKLPPASEAAFTKVFKSGELQCRRIIYGSDGLRVVTYVLRPAKSAPNMPILLSLRGGNRELGRVDERLLAGPLAGLALAGYVVVAPNYRGADGGEGKDEFGGDDVHDVLNVVPVARKQPDVNPEQLYLFGASRGAIMAYLALRDGLPARAAVILGGLSDAEASIKERPEMAEVFEELVPDFKKRRRQALRERSGIHAADKITTPLLLLHGGKDWRVSPSQALMMASRLQALGRDYGLIIYPDGDHGLTQHREDVQREMLRFFAAHR